MNSNKEAELRKRLGAELTQACQFEPNSEQDAIFNKALAETLEKQTDKVRTSYIWQIAAVMILVLSGFLIMSQHNSVKIPPSEFLVELIDASNKIEKELAHYDREKLDSLQYVEALNIRQEMAELDNALNVLYQSNANKPSEEIQALWQERLKMARQLKAIYENQYTMARI